MEVILLENVRNLGKFGHKVKVAKGYGRNFLIPQGKAVPASSDNLAKFEARRADLEQAAKSRLVAAQARAAEIAAIALKIAAKAAEEGKLYGSIGTLEISRAFKQQGVEVSRNEIRLPEGPFREIGEFTIEIQLHAEVVTEAKLQIVPERD
ncbi:MAG: 50S ribosomal protein L9 [Gammaproteobacteria bacterium]